MRGFLATLTAALCLLPSLTSAQPIPQLSLEQLEQQITKGDHGKIAVLAAEQGGETVYHRRFDKKAEGSPVDIRSAGKSITAIALGMAIADGKLSGTDAKVWPLLGSDRPEPFASITVGDLLGMSSALDCNDWEKRSPGQEERMYRKRAWRDFALALPAREYARDADGEGPFSYCTAGVFLLGQIVQEATGERFDHYVQRRLFDPLDIESVVWRTSRSGEIQSGGQLTISSDALLKIGRLVLNEGVWEGQELVPSSWIKQMLKPRHSMSEHVHYASLWWLTPLRSKSGYVGAWMMKGNGGNIVAIVPHYDAVLVVQARNYNKQIAERAAFIGLTTMLGSLEPPEPVTEE